MIGDEVVRAFKRLDEVVLVYIEVKETMCALLKRVEHAGIFFTLHFFCKLFYLLYRCHVVGCAVIKNHGRSISDNATVGAGIDCRFFVIEKCISFRFLRGVNDCTIKDQRVWTAIEKSVIFYL